jgi:hypothetical protein
MAASSAIAGMSRPAFLDNFPPRQLDLAHGSKQIYLQPDRMRGLQLNCDFTHVRIVADSMMTWDGHDSGRGVVACKDFAAGDVIGWLWGKFIDPTDWLALRTRGWDNSAEPGGEDFVTPVREGVFRCCSIPVQTPSLLLASEQCPMAYVNQGASQHTTNVRIVIPEHVLVPPGGEFDRATAFQYIEVKATKAIRNGEELLTWYNWTKETWDDAAKLAVAARKRKHGTRDRFPAGASVAPARADSSSTDAGASDMEHRRLSLEQHRLYLSSSGMMKEYKCCQQNCFHRFPSRWVTNERYALSRSADNIRQSCLRIGNASS